MNSDVIEEITINARAMQFSGLVCGPSDGDLVLLLHGFPEFADSWRDTMPELAKAGYRVVAVNQRGYSSGAHPNRVRDYAVDELVADVLAIAAALGHHQFHLAGHDWGGIVSWVVAARYPERLRSLSIISTPHVDALLQARRTDPDQRRRSRYIAMFRLPFHIAEWLLLRRKAKALRAVFKGKLPGSRLDNYVHRLTLAGTLTAGLNWYRALDLKIAVGKISVPTLFVWGSDDQALGRTAAMGTASYVTGPYRFIEIEGASHWLLEEKPEIISTAMTAHLRRYDAAQRPPTTFPHASEPVPLLSG